MTKQTLREAVDQHFQDPQQSDSVRIKLLKASELIDAAVDELLDEMPDQEDALSDVKERLDDALSELMMAI